MTPDDIRRTLMVLRPPPDDPDQHREAMSDALLQARAHPALEADWRIAEAALQHPDAMSLLQEALRYLGDSRREDRVYVHEQLSRLRATGGDPTRARGHLRSVLELARRTNPTDQGRLALRLGCALLAAGLPQEAESVLEEASQAAMASEDTLIQLGTATILAALRLEAGDTTAAFAHGARTAMLGAQRGNWIAIADGIIMQSVCHQQHGDWSQALRTVLHGSLRLREAHALAALNLLQAHLVEMRQKLGEEDFDVLFQRETESQSSGPRQVESPLQTTQ